MYTNIKNGDHFYENAYRFKHSSHFLLVCIKCGAIVYLFVVFALTVS